jgi:transporter family protein
VHGGRGWGRGCLRRRGEWRSPASLPSRSLLFLILSGLATGLSWICYYRALQLGPASLVSPVDKLSLAVAVLLSVIFLGERLSVWQWSGAGLVTLGALLLAFK